MMFTYEKALKCIIVVDWMYFLQKSLLQCIIVGEDKKKVVYTDNL